MVSVETRVGVILFFFFLVLEEEEEEEETKGGGACDARLISVETRVGVMRFLSFFGGCFASTSLDGAVALGCCFSSTRTGVIRRLRFLDDALIYLWQSLLRLLSKGTDRFSRSSFQTLTTKRYQTAPEHS